jgi:glutathione S-transferase
MTGEAMHDRLCGMRAGPFSHRALLTMAEKDAPYKEEFIDFDNKPKW